MTTNSIPEARTLGREILNPTALDSCFKTVKITALKLIEVAVPMILFLMPKLVVGVSEWAVSHRSYLEGVLVKKKFKISDRDNSCSEDRDRIIPKTEGLTENDIKKKIKDNLSTIWGDITRNLVLSIETNKTTFIAKRKTNSSVEISENQIKTIENEEDLGRSISKFLKDQKLSLETYLKIVANAHQGIFAKIIEEYTNNYDNFFPSRRETNKKFYWSRRGNQSLINIKIKIQSSKDIVLIAETEAEVIVRKDPDIIIPSTQKILTETIEINLGEGVCSISSAIKKPTFF